MKSVGRASSQLGANPVSLNNLRRGIQQLYDRHTRQGRPSIGEWDFHNTLYRTLEDHRVRGLDEEFWAFLVTELANWHAIRGRADHTKTGIRHRGLEQFPALQRCFYGLAGKATNELPTVETLEWNDVEPLFRVAHRIKGVARPTFASKLCHFLVPAAYFVIDGTLVKRSWKDYRVYWDDSRIAWLDASDKQALKEELLKRMPDQPCATYPWPTKITELCQFDVRS